MKVFWKQFFICKYLWNIQEGATASPFTIEKNAYSHIISIVTSRGEVICLTSVLKTQSCYCVENNCREVWQVRFPGSRVWAGDSNAGRLASWKCFQGQPLWEMERKQDWAEGELGCTSTNKSPMTPWRALKLELSFRVVPNWNESSRPSYGCIE